MLKKIRYTALTLVLAFGAYAGVWQIYSKKFERHIQEQMADIQAKGFDVSFSHMEIKGFPFGYDVVVTNLDIQRGEAFHTWVDGVITFSAKFWKPQEISSVAGGTHHLKVDDFTTEGQGFVLRSFAIDPLRFEFFYENLLVRVAGKEVLKAKELEYDIDLTPKESLDNATLRMRLTELEVDQLKDSPLGPKIEHIVFDGSLKGQLFGTTADDRIKHWYENDGEIVIREFSLKWGEATAKGDGDLTLDENLQPVGAFSATFRGLDHAVDAYEKAGLIDKTKASLLRAGFQMLHSADGTKIPITLQDSKLMLAAVPVMKLPKIEW